MSESGESQSPGGSAGDPGAGTPSRGTNLAALAGAVILIGLLAFALYRRSHSQAPTGGPSPAASATPSAGTTIAAVVPFHLSPEAAILAERYRCVCSCSLLLNVCTCNNTPGSNDMKKHLQDLVRSKKAPPEIDAAMVAKYGPQVLLSNPAGPASAARAVPAAPKTARRPKR